MLFVLFPSIEQANPSVDYYFQLGGSSTRSVLFFKPRDALPVTTRIMESTLPTPKFLVKIASFLEGKWDPEKFPGKSRLVIFGIIWPDIFASVKFHFTEGSNHVSCQCEK